MKKRYIVITGASKGIGLATAHRLLNKGFEVHGIARSTMQQADATESASLQQLLESTNDFHLHTADLMDERACDNVIDDILKVCKPDALVCNAGSGRFGMLEQYSSKQIQAELQLNLVAHILVTRRLLPQLKQSARSDIVFIGSESALQGGRYGSVYSAAKFGLRGFAQALHHECATTNCHVGIVNPGMVRTGFFDQLDFQPGSDKNNALQADDVAHAVLQMLSSPDHAVIEEININPLKRVVSKK